MIIGRIDRQKFTTFYNRNELASVSLYYLTISIAKIPSREHTLLLFCTKLHSIHKTIEKKSIFFISLKLNDTFVCTESSKQAITRRSSYFVVFVAVNFQRENRYWDSDWLYEICLIVCVLCMRLRIIHLYVYTFLSEFIQMLDDQNFT